MQPRPAAHCGGRLPAGGRAAADPGLRERRLGAHQPLPALPRRRRGPRRASAQAPDGAHQGHVQGRGRGRAGGDLALGHRPRHAAPRLGRLGRVAGVPGAAQAAQAAGLDWAADAAGRPLGAPVRPRDLGAPEQDPDAPGGHGARGPKGLPGGPDGPRRRPAGGGGVQLLPAPRQARVRRERHRAADVPGQRGGPGRPRAEEHWPASRVRRADEGGEELDPLRGPRPAALCVLGASARGGGGL
mmetsp:Transcript_50775/g.132078  ORF Transcript_50775/g.132078 Transcript_50775/m.132078 type:complete len:243 (+) Transcript_50775:1141-1869(+)